MGAFFHVILKRQGRAGRVGCLTFVFSFRLLFHFSLVRLFHVVSYIVLLYICLVFSYYSTIFRRFLQRMRSRDIDRTLEALI